jgi:hypothetical protein
MDKLIVSYKYRHDWYVGEIYRFFHQRLVEKYPKIKFEFIENDDFKNTHKLGDYSNNLPSVLNQYNFLLINPINNKTYINSLNDFAPFTVYPGSGVEIFDVQKFSFCSNFDESIIEPIKKYNPTPSFYILENFSDLDRVQRFRKVKRTIDKAHFLGLMYGKRFDYLEIFKDSDYFDIQPKDRPEFFKTKEQYFEKISQYKMSLSIDGAAKICHRDIECIGVGNLLLRETLEIKMNDPLLPNIHYLEILKPDEKRNFSSHNEESKKYFKELVEDRIQNTIKNKRKTNKIIKEGINWYEQNCLPEKQFQLIDKFTNNLDILE